MLPLPSTRRGRTSMSGQSPAHGSELLSAIDQAIQVLTDQMENEGNSYGVDAENEKIWQELLKRSRAKIVNQTAPCIRKGDLAAPLAIRLDGRRWERFQRWFVRAVENELLTASEASGIPILYGARLANRRGGYAEASEAIYFVSFDPPEVSTRGRSIQAATTAPARLELEQSFPRALKRFLIIFVRAVRFRSRK